MHLLPFMINLALRKKKCIRFIKQLAIQMYDANQHQITIKVTISIHAYKKALISQNVANNVYLTFGVVVQIQCMYLYV